MRAKGGRARGAPAASPSLLAFSTTQPLAEAIAAEATHQEAAPPGSAAPAPSLFAYTPSLGPSAFQGHMFPLGATPTRDATLPALALGLPATATVAAADDSLFDFRTDPGGQASRGDDTPPTVGAGPASLPRSRFSQGPRVAASVTTTMFAYEPEGADVAPGSAPPPARGSPADRDSLFASTATLAAMPEGSPLGGGGGGGVPPATDARPPPSCP